MMVSVCRGFVDTISGTVNIINLKSIENKFVEAHDKSVICEFPKEKWAKKGNIFIHPNNSGLTNPDH